MIMAVPVGAIFGGAASLLGIGNSLSMQSQQQDNFERQMQFAKYQFDKSLSYNSMVNQVARMRAAGVNPALAIGAGQLGTASSPVSQPSAPTPVSLGVGESLNGLSGVISAEGQNMVAKEDAKRLAIDNDTRRIKNITDIQNAIKEGQKLGLDVSLLREELYRSIIDSSYHSRKTEAEIRLMNEQSNYNDSLTLLNNEYLNWVPQEKRAYILTSASQVYRNYAEGKASLEQAKAAIRNSLKQNGIFFKDKNLEDEYVDNVVGAMEAQGYVTTSENSSYSVGSRHVISASGSHGSTQVHHTRKNKSYRIGK